MINKGFAEKKTNTETPNGVSFTEKPLKSKQTSSARVDINVLKSKLQENESKEFKRNAYILSSLILSLGILGIYLSLWWNLQMWMNCDLIWLWKILAKILKTK